MNNKDEKEFRGVWLHQSLFDRDKTRAAEQIVSLFDAYAKIGINNIFCYNALKEDNNFDWDFLQLIIDEGHKRGIGIHCIFCPGHEVNLEKALAEHHDWLIKDIQGKIYPSFNIALPQVRKYWLDKISKALQYDIDGIHLDYIRYPLNQMFSYDSITCQAFKNEYGVTPLEVSHDGGSIIWCEWIEWNGKQIESMVRETHDLITKSGKSVLLGADIFPGPDESKIEIAQDWGAWADEGIIDFVCPMLYTNNTDLFAKYLDQALKAAAGKCKVFAGIGISTSHNRITEDIMIKEIEISREKNAGGVVFFSGNSFTEDFRKRLEETVFKPLATGK
jgi:uncharacterized lipoprotein YddW (UPF0748 family)